MTQKFFIKKGSLLPLLRMELYNDGRNAFHKEMLINASLQNCDVTFSMKDIDTDILKISNAPAEIVKTDDCECSDTYILQYTWKERDVKKNGTYKAWFDIKFRGDVKYGDTHMPVGNLIVPIQEELIINII